MGFDVGDIRTLTQLRVYEKLGDWGAAHIKTIYGTGYKLEVKSDGEK